MKSKDDNGLTVIEAEFKRNRRNINIPRMPKGLSPAVKKMWKKVIKILNRTTVLPQDQISLHLLSDSLVLYEKTKKILEEKGETYQTTNEEGASITLPRPEVEILQIYSGMVFESLKVCLLTPDSRILGDDN